MPQKVPPPPPIATQDPQLNRWFLELTAILNDSGGIDVSSVTGLDVVVADVTQNTNDITALQSGSAGQSASITALNSQVGALQVQVASLATTVAALSSRAQVFNGTVNPAAGVGNIGDWYANTAGAVGNRIFVKTGVATWFAFPF